MTYTKTVHLPVGPDEAFALITEPERLRRWQAVSATIELRAGGDYRMTINPGHVAAGTYREVEPGRRVVFGWGWVGDDELPPDASTVAITIEPAADGGSQITLTHEGLTGEQAVAHAAGWDHYLSRLTALASHGDAGPDEWSAVPNPLNPVSAADAALAALQPLLRSLTPEDQPKTTPCDEFTCHQLVEHLMASLVALDGMVGVQVNNPGQGSLENRISLMATEAIAGWRDVDLTGAVTTPGGGEMPASVLAGVLPLELMIHGWDMAQSSGKPMPVSDDLVAYLTELAQPIIPGGRGRNFAEEVTPAADASALDRLAAFAGRAPLSA